MQKIVYITAQSPFDSIETFILTEMLSLKRLGVQLFVLPRNISNTVFHSEAQALSEDIWSIPLLNFQIIKESLRFFCKNPRLSLEIIDDIALRAISAKIALKNLLILPKALYLSTLLIHKSILHIHAHRGSTPSTIAYIISKVTNIPWSFTLHRFDIYENNILARKVDAASFVRCISQKGKEDLLTIIGNKFAAKVKVIHMGVEVPHCDIKFNDSISHADYNNKTFRLSVPANLVSVKGHKYLIDACKILVQKGLLNFKCSFYGDGPLKNKVRNLIKQKGLENYIQINGVIPHNQLIKMYEEREIDVVILPSIITDKGEFEGIPVALMEAMAFGIPVISTDTGGIPELIGDDSGIMVREKDPEAIANSIEKILNNMTYYNAVGERGRKKVESDFNIAATSKELVSLFFQYGEN